ncbi:hypothetical protein JW979_02930 [bacterium]|nr:hypothetical protein [candidate division CSSED10-310 bacterium]
MKQMIFLTLIVVLCTYSLASADIFVNEVGSAFSTPFYTGNGNGPSSHDGSWSTFFEDTNNTSYIKSEHVLNQAFDVIRLEYQIKVSGLSYGKYDHDIHVEYYIAVDSGNGYEILTESYYVNHWHWYTGDDVEAYGVNLDTGQVSYSIPIDGVIKVKAFAMISTSAGENHGCWSRSAIGEIQIWSDDLETPTPIPTETPTFTPTETPTSTPTFTPTSTPTETPVPDDYVWVEDASGCDGEIIEVYLFVYNAFTAIDRFRIRMRYDGDMLEYVGCEPGDINPGWSDWDCRLAGGPKNRRVTISGSADSGSEIPIDSYGSFVRILFRVNCSDCENWDQSPLSIDQMGLDLAGFISSDGVFEYFCP